VKQPAEVPQSPIAVGSRVIKTSGDYTFEGTVVAALKKRSGVQRYVVEDDRGLLLIMSQAQIAATTGRRETAAR
jgi:hypothetical protein